MTAALDILLLKGGPSTEREVSLVTGAACAQALREKGHRVEEYDLTRDLAALSRTLLKGYDVVFNALHGHYGEDGCVQGALELMGQRYSHSGVLPSAMAMDKPLAKRLFASAGLTTPGGRVCSKAEVLAGDPLPRPYVIKPPAEGSSVGVKIVRELDNAPPMTAESWKFGDQVLVEPYIPGRELTVGVLGDGAGERPLAVTELKPKVGFYDYEAKVHRAGGPSISSRRRSRKRAIGRARHGRGRGGAPLAGLPQRHPRGLPLRRHRRRAGHALPAGAQYPARHDAALPGAGAGALLRHELSRSLPVDRRGGHEPMSAAKAKRPTQKNPTAKPRKTSAAATKAKARSQPKAKPAVRTTSARPKPGLFDRLRPRTLARGVALVLLVGVGLWSWQSGFVSRQVDAAFDGLYGLSADLGLRVGNVHVVGREHTGSEEILATLAVAQGSPLLAFDPHGARQRLEQLPWVESAAVERRLPDLIHVTLVERRPLALWQLGGLLQVIDERGQVIAGARPEDFAGLPMVVGEGAAGEAQALFAVLASEPYLGSRVVAAVRVAGRRWNLRLEPGIDVRLPEFGTLEAWQTLARLDREKGLLSRDLVVIDLRQPDRLLVRPSPGVVVEPLSPVVAGEDT